MDLVVRPLTAELWPALEDLFGRQGASNGCWCMYWRIGRRYAERPREENRAEFQSIVERGPPPGLVALDGDLAVGWCQVTPRSVIPNIERKRFLSGVDDARAWSISCFYVRRGYRRRGVTQVLIEAAVEMAGKAGAPALEAYPVDSGVKGATSNAFTGVASTFRRAGFHEVTRRSLARPVMRRVLTGG
jgi:GNAT superfamily N-acetyltransferase